jgi:hypothetical protein
MSRKIPETPIAASRRSTFGAVLSAAGLVFIVPGLLMAGTYGWLEARDFVIGDTVVLEQEMCPRL